MSPRVFLRDQRGAAASEFALILPLLILLMFCGSEAAHFVWTQHKLTEAVRNGARFASRLQVKQVCDGPDSVLADPELANVVMLTRTGQLGDATIRPVVPGWTDAQVTVTVSCESFVDTGIYTDLRAPGPVVTVAATNVNYHVLFGLAGGIGAPIALNARSSAAVIGI